MSNILTLAAIWLGLGLIAAVFSHWLKLASALTELFVGILAQFIIVTFIAGFSLGSDEPWIQFLSNAGAILLTFLAGAELDPDVFKLKWKEASTLGFFGFIAPFLGCAAIAYYFLDWSKPASLLTGVALSTTSVAVVYAVMLESGLNTTNYGKTLLAACFVNDLGTVLALGFLFSPFTIKTLVFFVIGIVVVLVLPYITPRIFKHIADKPSEIESKYILFVLFALGALAGWAGSEAVLPAYIIGMVLAGSVGKNHVLIRRLRTMTLGLLTPFYFIRAGSYVSLPALFTGFATFVYLFFAKITTKFVGVFPITKIYKAPHKEAMYTMLMMSTGLTFGSISALYGLTHNIIDVNQYSIIIAVVIGSAIIPTIIANIFFMPHHHLHAKKHGLYDPKSEPE